MSDATRPRPAGAHPAADDAAGTLSLAPGTHALIQGATRGIGLALTRLLLENDDVASVIATGRRPRASEGLQALHRQHGARLVVAPLDAADESSIASAAAALGDGARPLRLLINCAGVLHEGPRMKPEKRIADLDAASVLRAFTVNALGPALVIKHFLPTMDRHARTIIANISARVGSITDNRLGGWYAYRASKAAQNMLTRTVAIELARWNRLAVCVALHPGTVETALSEPFRKRVPRERLFTPARAAQQLLAVLEGLGPEDSGGFFAWDGQPIPW